METVGSYEAKTHLPALLERVARGESFTITKHGKPIAQLVPMPEDTPKMTVQEAIDGLLEFRKAHPLLPGESVIDLIREGRKD